MKKHPGYSGMDPLADPRLIRGAYRTREAAQAPKLAYKVHRDDQGRLYWIRQTEEGHLRYDTEPNSTWLKRTAVYIFSVLPIEWLL